MGKNNTSLEGFMYDSEGNFKPLTSNYGNIDGELSYLRNTYMESEKNYFEELLSIDEVAEEFLGYLDYSSEALFEVAMNLQNKLENGEIETPEEKEKMEKMSPEERDNYHMRNLEFIEGKICLLLAATRDKVKIKDLVKNRKPEKAKKTR